MIKPRRTRWYRLLPALVLLLAPAMGSVSAADDDFLGEWSMATRLQGSEITATMTLFLADDGSIGGLWVSSGREMALVEIVIEGDKISFDREIPGGIVIHFEGSRDGDRLDGVWRGPFGEALSRGTRGFDGEAPDPDAIPDLHSRPIVERDGARLLWAGEDAAGNVDWFDMTDSTIDPERFQFGIGKDTIDSIDRPEFVGADDPRLAGRGVSGETPVLGVEIDGIARAYPVDLMSMHEVVNDDFGGEAYAVLW